MESRPSRPSMPPAAPVVSLIEELNKLPGIGPKSAQRLTYHLVRLPAEEARLLAEAILAVKEQVSLCTVCLNITDRDPCNICTDPARDRFVLCLVEQPLDVLVLERTGVFKGLYHVLHGVISPMNGVGPEDLKVQELLARLQNGEESHVPSEGTDSSEGGQGRIGEVILATNPNLEGEATAMYLQRLLTPLGIRVTRLARGLPTGGELEYADEMTLIRAFQGRQEF